MAEADALQLPASEEEAHEQQLDMMDPSQKAMRNAADGALRQAICCGALSPLRREPRCARGARFAICAGRGAAFSRTIALSRQTGG